MIQLVKDKLRLNDGSLGFAYGIFWALGPPANNCSPVETIHHRNRNARIVITISSIVIAVSFPIVLWLNNWFEIAECYLYSVLGVGFSRCFIERSRRYGHKYGRQTYQPY